MNSLTLLKGYDLSQLTIAVLGGHSALDVCRGAKKLGFKTLAVCQKGREKTYANYYATKKTSNGEVGCVDEVLLVDQFKDILKPNIQEQLRKKNAIFIHNRYFWVYFEDFSKIEQAFNVPIFGTRDMVRWEERHEAMNQYVLLQKAGIRIPKLFTDFNKIDRLVIVKVNEAARGYERAFFFCNSSKDFDQKSAELLKKKTITREALQKAVIEEYILGAQVNLNFFYSPLTQELELMGTDTRRQTNIDGYLRLPADVQQQVLQYAQPKLIETGHIAVTIKESLIEKAFALGEKFVAACKQAHPSGIIGPFALQGMVTAEEGKEDIVIFDVSFRIPGSPGTMFTPYTAYRYGSSISYGERIAMEIKEALKQKKLPVICT
ncbi:DUF1297 domain-containing protein [Candidatus Woesearchaeota archaeon]|nr:DUF1297 domain-containing protein [Candidatus Woesearchaeota archaeon]